MRKRKKRGKDIVQTRKREGGSDRGRERESRGNRKRDRFGK